MKAILKTAIASTVLLATCMEQAASQQLIVDPSAEFKPNDVCTVSGASSPNSLSLLGTYSYHWQSLTNARILDNNAASTCIAQFPSGSAAGKDDRSVIMNCGGPVNAYADDVLTITGTKLTAGYYTVCVMATPLPVNGTAIVDNDFDIILRGCADKTILTVPVGSSNTYNWTTYSDVFEITSNEEASCNYFRVLIRMRPNHHGSSDYHGQMLFDLLQINPCSGPNDVVCSTDPEPYDDKNRNFRTKAGGLAAGAEGLQALFHVTPNPSTDHIVVDFGEEGADVAIADMQGRVVITQKSAPSGVRLDISKLSAGAYVVRIRTNAGVNQKLFIKN